MKEALYYIVGMVAKLHNLILSLNDSYESSFTDKELHFLVIGALGMAILFVIYPLFKLLSRHHVMVIAWIYVFTLILVITFAIEIGQGITHTGVMDFADIEFGVIGFLFMFLIFSLVRAVYHGILHFIRWCRKK